MQYQHEHDPMESMAVDVGTPGLADDGDAFLWADEYAPDIDIDKGKANHAFVPHAWGAEFCGHVADEGMPCGWAREDHVDPGPCEVNDCANDAFPCECGADHCSDHPHEADANAPRTLDVEELERAMFAASEGEDYQSEVDSLRLALDIALSRWPEVQWPDHDRPQ